MAASSAFLLILLLVLAFPRTTAARPRPAPCPDATYRVLGGPIFAADPSSDEIRVEGQEVSIGAACEPGEAKRSMVAAVRKKTRVRALWTDCPRASAKKVKLRLKIDLETCETATGKISYRDLSVPAGVPRGPGGPGASKKPPRVVFKIEAIAKVNESLRIGTFNTQFLPSTVYEKPLEDAARMSARIIESDYDFIVLNEVFDDDARAVFVKHLATSQNGHPPYYPYYVSNLDGDTVFAEQSGLAIYSKFPFENMLNPGCDGDACGDNCEGNGCGKVAFEVYHDCDDTAWPWDIGDCDADKGMALIRVRNPNSGRIYSVFFTHTQASYWGDDDHSDVEEHFFTREAQLGLANDFMVDHLTQHQRDSQDIFLMGDLNIDGNMNNSVQPLGPPKNRYEWKWHFGSANYPLQGFFFDPWAWEMSLSGTDPGLTNMTEYAGVGGGGARLDYIARHAPNSPDLAMPGHRDLCFQHMTLAYNLFWADKLADYEPKGMGVGGVYSLSDHYGLNADINLWGPQCRPVAAVVIDPPLGVPEARGGVITYPGSMQWWKIERPGTYSIGILDPTTLQVDDSFEQTLYKDRDLSTPVPQYKGETTEVDFDGVLSTFKKYELLQAPFFIRVKHHYRTGTGAYLLVVLRHDCSSKAQACTLRPGTVKDHELPTYWTGDDEAWFDLDTEKIPASLDPQQITYKLTKISPAADGLFTLRLYKKDGTSLLQKSADSKPGPGGMLEISLSDSVKAKKKRYLTVTRSGGPSYVSPDETSFSIGWTTNLSVIYRGSAGLAVQCAEENDSTSPDDEIYLYSVGRDGHDTHLDVPIETDFEIGLVRPVEKLIGAPVYFYDRVKIRLREEDDLSEDDWADYTIHALAEEDPLPRENVRDEEPFDTGGLYDLIYSLAHWLPD